MALSSNTPYRLVSPSEEELRRRCTPRIERLIRSVLGPDSEHEDLVHDVLITVFCHITTLRDPDALDGWVSQVTLNRLKYVLRKRAARRALPLETDPGVPSSSSDFEAREIALRATQMLDRLPTGDRMLLEWSWFTTRSLEEMAELAGCSVSTLRRRLYRARQRFELFARRDPLLSKRFDDPKSLPTRNRLRSRL